MPRAPRCLIAFALLCLVAPPAVIAGAEEPPRFEVTELEAEHTGHLAHLVDGGLAEPLSVATADFDSDGMPDLVIGYADGAQGMIALYLGNLEAVYPTPGEPAGEPFLPVSRVFEVAQRPDVVGAGDFDSDGRFDVVVGSLGGTTLALHRGDGRGGLADAERIELGGRLTAMAVGEVNRRDGLADVVVGVDGWDGPHVLVFEGPGGALRGAPERIDVPDRPESVAVGRFDDDGSVDLAVFTTSRDLLIRGRDRRLSWSDAARASVPPAHPEPLTSEALKRAGAAAAAPTEAIDAGADAWVAMRLNRDALPDLVALSDGASRPTILKSLTRGVFVVDSTADDGDFSTGDGVCDTDDSAGDGPCTLRAAIQQANATTGADAVEFDIAGTGPHTIQPLSALPAITEALTVDGFTQPGASANTIPFPGALDTVVQVELDGALVPPGANGLDVFGGSSTIRGLAVGRFAFSGAWTGSGIKLSSSGNIVEGCFVGTDPTGTLDRGSENGIRIYQSNNNLVGGPTPAARNLLSGGENEHGVDLYGFSGGGVGNVIQGNLIGTDISGSFGIPGGYSGNGISITSYSAGGNLVGGSGPGEGNVISIPNQCAYAVHIYAGSGTVVQGNLIGTNADGTAGINSNCLGIFSYPNNAPSCTIGGTQPGAGNVISGNANYGIFNTNTGWVVQGNVIGVLPDRTTALGNSNIAVYLRYEASDTAIGGDAAGAGNIIANSSSGPGIQAAYRAGFPYPTGHTILGNSIYGNQGIGIDLCSTEYCTEGPTPNDAGDTDSGVNTLQNFPVITGVSGAGAVVDATVDSTPSTEFRIEFFATTECDQTGYGEGGTFLGFDTVMTDAGGTATFASILTTAVPAGSFVTATATDPAGNTSEFSACFEYDVSADLAITKDDGVTQVMPGGQVTYTVVASNLGPDGVTAATVHDTLSDFLSCTWTCVPDGGAACTSGPFTGNLDDLADLPVGGTASYTSVCDVDHTATGTLENTAEVVPPDGLVDPDGSNNSASDVDDILELDYGDAPDPSYPTLWDSDGARHLLGGPLFLGSSVDGDPDGQPDPGAGGDDGDGADDEDGIAFTSVLMTGYDAAIEVTASGTGWLNAWLDLNGDGDWADAGEQIFSDEPMAAGIIPLALSVPAGAAVGTTYARFRIDSSGGLAPTGLASDGEVEDELVQIRFSALDVPETGQTTSWAAGDDGTFQVGVPWPDTRFTVHGDGTITDELTGLMWAQDNVNPGPAPCSPGVTRTWFDSLAYVDCLNTNAYLGHDDWRMPNVVEINSLVSFTEVDHRPWWESQGFTSASVLWWWSSTTNANGLATAYCLHGYGYTSSRNKGGVTGTAVWPVRGGGLGEGTVELPASGQVHCWDASYAEVPCEGTGQDGDHRAGAPWPEPRFEVSGDCVTDRLTGLMWTRDANLFGARTWPDAVDDTLGLSLCGFDDWRLPSTLEARTLWNFDPDDNRPWWESQGFVNAVYLSTWSGTSSASGPDVAAWAAYGQNTKEDGTNVGVWPVRGNLQSSLADLAVSTSDSADPVTPGENVTVTVEVTNLGPDPADEVRVAVTLPDGATFVAASGTGWSCAEDTGVVTCTVAILAVGAAPVIDVELTTPFAPGDAVVTSVLVDSLRDDPVGDNSSAVEGTTLDEVDFGDAPDPAYPTLLASDGARHVLGGGLFLGTAVDGEADGQPTTGADGDDLNGTDDEDGVAFTTLVARGTMAPVDVQASAPGVLNAWVDFNADGDWTDPGEQVVTDVSLTAGVNPLSFAVPVDAALGATVARFRLDSAGGLAPTGLADDGEVEDHVATIVSLDYGDAPDPGYPTLLASDGARHVLGGGLFLGTAVDGEADGQPTTGADGDDLNGTDDEDGVAFTSVLQVGFDATLDVTASASGLLNAWLDLNADGDWDDPGEQVFTDSVVPAGVSNLVIPIPLDAAVGSTFARFRLDSAGGLAPTGLAADGEVEDHAVTIEPSAEVSVSVADSPDPAVEGGALTYFVAVANNGALDATGVALTDTLPAEAVFSSVTPGAPSCSHAAGVVSCDLGTLAGGAATQVVVTVDLPHGTVGTLTSTAVVVLDQSDPVPANNTGLESTLVVADADHVFSDGFESGLSDRWSDTEP